MITVENEKFWIRYTDKSNWICMYRRNPGDTPNTVLGSDDGNIFDDYDTDLDYGGEFDAHLYGIASAMESQEPYLQEYEIAKYDAYVKGLVDIIERARKAILADLKAKGTPTRWVAVDD